MAMTGVVQTSLAFAALGMALATGCSGTSSVLDGGSPSQGPSTVVWPDASPPAENNPSQSSPDAACATCEAAAAQSDASMGAADARRPDVKPTVDGRSPDASMTAGEEGGRDANLTDASAEAIVAVADAIIDGGVEPTVDAMVDVAPPPPPPPSCPNGNGLFCGSDGIGGAANTLYCCSGGTPKVAALCAGGCTTKAAGIDDQCAMSSCPSSGAGLYCAGNGLPGCPNSLYRCAIDAQGNVEVTLAQRCVNGCKANGAGVNDACL